MLSHTTCRLVWDNRGLVGGVTGVGCVSWVRIRHSSLRDGRLKASQVILCVNLAASVFHQQISKHTVCWVQNSLEVRKPSFKHG